MTTEANAPAPKTILVIDRDARCRALLRAALGSGDGFEVREAAGALEGLALFRQDPSCALIVIDPVEHPHHHWPVLGQLRELHGTMPLLVLSAYQTSTGVAQAMELGADDFLFKPLDIEEFRSAVHLLTRDVPRRKGRKTASRTSLMNKIKIHNEGDGTFVEIVAPTNSPHVDRFERFVRRLLEHALPKDEFFRLRLALEETITNAIEWGNRNDIHKQLKLSYCLLPDRLTIRIEDQGEGFDPQHVPDPSLNPKAHIETRRASGKRMGGWGIFLSQKAVDDLKYNEKGNVVILTKYLRDPKELESRTRLLKRLGGGSGSHPKPPEL